MLAKYKHSKCFGKDQKHRNDNKKFEKNKILGYLSQIQAKSTVRNTSA